MSEKLNVLFIITDQHRADHMSCAGKKILKTPNLDRLANDGIRFTNAYCANPMCMPNRSSILTGVYPNVHGCRSNGINLPSGVPTFVESLRKSGYSTASVGKLHLNFFIPSFKRKTYSAEKFSDWIHRDFKQTIKKFPLPYYGFEHVEIVIGHGDVCTGHYTEWLEERAPQYLKRIEKRFEKFFNLPMYDTELPEHLYNTRYVEERTIKFLEKHANGEHDEKPFFLHCSFPDPHHPVCPPGKYKDLYKPEDVDLPLNFYDFENLYNHPLLGLYLRQPGFRGAILRDATEEETKKFISSTYGSIAMIDHSIGNILASLEKFGLADNTIVIYTSDHGDLMGDHGMILKGPCPFSGILRVPLIWKVPGLTTPSITNSLASSIDISSTILNLLNIKKKFCPPDIQGIDLTPILKDSNNKVRSSCFIEEDEDGMTNVNFRLRHLITENYKLTIYAQLEGYGDLYNIQNDPDELINLWNDNKDLSNKLTDRLLHEALKAQSRLPRRQALS
ncbi:MAG: sulfatase [Promethearchaeota archaeon]